jgi:hypothetical protein
MKKSNFNNYTPEYYDYSFVDEISVATLTKLLISKGLLTVEEVISEEKKNRSNHNTDKSKKMPWYKQWAARQRWSRRLTAKLFGWHWKKVTLKNDKKYI